MTNEEWAQQAIAYLGTLHGDPVGAALTIGRYLGGGHLEDHHNRDIMDVVGSVGAPPDAVDVLPPNQRLFDGRDRLMLLEQNPNNRSLWEGYCTTCGQLNQRMTCYRCGDEIESHAGVRLMPPLGSLDSRSDRNVLCDRCVIAFQEWANADEQVITNTRAAFQHPVALPKL